MLMHAMMMRLRCKTEPPKKKTFPGRSQCAPATIERRATRLAEMCTRAPVEAVWCFSLPFYDTNKKCVWFLRAAKRCCCWTSFGVDMNPGASQQVLEENFQMRRFIDKFRVCCRCVCVRDGGRYLRQSRARHTDKKRFKIWSIRRSDRLRDRQAFACDLKNTREGHKKWKKSTVFRVWVKIFNFRWCW